MAREQTETGSQQRFSSEDRGVWALCQTRRYQGYYAATFQVRRSPCSSFCLVKAKKCTMKAKSTQPSVAQHVLTSSCPSPFQHWHQCSNQEVQKLSQPVQETGLLTGYLHSARPGTPPPPAEQQVQDWECPRWQDQPTGIRPEASLSPRAQSHTEARAGQAEARVEHNWLAGSQAWGSPQTDMSRTFARGVGNKSKGVAQSQCPLCSVLKFSKCLRLLPSLLQHIFFQAWRLSQSKTGCVESLKAEPCISAALSVQTTAAGLQTLDGTAWSKLQVLLSVWQRERKSANSWQSGHILWLKEGTLLTFWDFTHFFLKARTLISAIL